MAQADSERAELTMSEHAQLGSLQNYLALSVPGVRVSRTAGRPAAGELGVLDVLELLASSSTLIALVKVLPEFLRSRRTGVTITMTVKGEPFTLTATNLDEVMPLLERLLNA